ncbi:MAG: hypothetical protein GY906_14545, partial [bacterium]|nr:hypothetical protein [bacterium]
MTVSLCWILPGHADNGTDLRFDRISIEDGLSQAGVLTIVQDNAGFLWMGTQDGLNRYDGYEIKVYRNDPDDPDSLSNNFVYAIFLDRSDRLWIGTLGGGLNRYDAATDSFTKYRHDDEDSESLSDDQVRAVFEDRAGRLWIGTSGGLNLFDPEIPSFVRYRHQPDNPHSLSHNIVRSIAEDDHGRLWLATFGGINRFDPRTESFERFMSDSSNSLSPRHDRAYVAYTDQRGIVWIGTEGGLHRWSPNSQGFISYTHDPNDSSSISHNASIAIYEDSNHQFWVGTEGGGLNLLDRENETFSHFRSWPQDPTSISGDHVYSIIEDRTGLLWVGTYSGGVNKTNPRLSAFAHYSHRPGDPTSLSHGFVRAFAQTDDGLWVGTRAGIDLMDPDLGTFQHIPIDLDEVRAIVAAPDETLWIGSRTNGLWHYHPSTGNTTHYLHSERDPKSLSNDSVGSLHLDSVGRLWIGTGSCLDLLTSPGEPFEHFCNDPTDPLSLGSDHVGAIFEDRLGILWLATDQGLRRWNSEEGTFTHFVHDPVDSNSLSNDSVVSIFEDSSNALWVGTMQGLNLFDRESGTVQRFRERDGLPNEVIYGIQEDAEANLWMSTNQGLVRFDPRTRSFDLFDARDGAQSREFNSGASFKCRSGRLYFGGVNGFNVFSAAGIAKDPYPPSVQITDFLLMNESVPIGTKDSPLQSHIGMADEIVLDHTHTAFSFQFAGIHLANPAKNGYQYRLEGFNSDWISTPADRRIASYMNLDPGDYTFQVRASNRDGVWADGRPIRVRILPSPWKTSLAYALYALAAASVVGTVVWKRARKLARERRTAKTLRTSEQRLNLALTGSGDGLWDWDLSSGEVFRSRV